MQETKETLPEWIEREAHAALHRFTNSAGSTVDGLRAVIAPYIEAVDAAQRRARELESWLLKPNGAPLAERIEQETRAAYARYSLDGDHQCAVDAMRTAVTPLAEGNVVLENRVRELEAALAKRADEQVAPRSQSETCSEQIDRATEAAVRVFRNAIGDAKDGLRAVLSPYVLRATQQDERVKLLEALIVGRDESRALLQSKIDKLEKDNAAGEYRVDELEKDLAEQRDHSRKLETELAAMRDVERTEHDATWAAYEVEKSRVRFFDALSIDSSNHGLAVALPMAMKPLLDIVVSTNADRNRLRSENLRLARDAVAAREREEASRAECAAHDARLADCQRELARQKDNVERLASDAGKFSHKWTALLNERDAALAEVASRGVYLTNLEARITDLDREVVKLNANANERKASHGNTVRQLKERAEQFERELIDERKAHVATKARLDAADFSKGVCGKRFDDERAAHENTKAELAQAQERLVHYEAELRRWIGMRDEEARRREAAEMALNAAESAAVDDHAALEAERSESEAAKARVERLEATCKMARAEAIAERERAEEYLATVNGLLRRERERTEVQS